jgi:predicted GNAT family N-acyltransferase
MGFVSASEAYLEDDIPHLKMIFAVHQPSEQN